MGFVSLHDHTPKASSFAGEAEWTDVDHLPELAFDHDDIAQLALVTLREQLESKHIGFEMLPKKFTLRQLQSLHEVVLDKKLDKRNFRKNIKRMDHVVPLNEKEEGVLHKPAQLFTYDANLTTSILDIDDLTTFPSSVRVPIGMDCANCTRTDCVDGACVPHPRRCGDLVLRREPRKCGTD